MLYIEAPSINIPLELECAFILHLFEGNEAVMPVISAINSPKYCSVVRG